MMRSKITPLVFLLLCFTAYAFAENKAVVDQPDLYWLSYIENGCCVHLTQIDSVGTVVKAPIKIEGGPTISLNGTSAINIWKSRSRDVLDEKTLTVVKTAKTGWAQPILVTQKADHNFAVLNRKQKLSLKFIPVSGSGKRTGKSHTVSFVGDNSLCYDGEFTYCAPGLVSADGKLLFWSILDLFERGGIYFQLLDNAGRPNVAQKNVNFFPEWIYPVAVSNILPEGTAYILFIDYSSPTGSVLYLQAFDPILAQKAGSPIFLAKKRDFYSVAIDPLARFVLYTYKNLHKPPAFVFQALDATGHPSGKSRVLVKRVDARSVHVLEDE